MKETGHRFRETILALGGGKAPEEVRKKLLFIGFLIEYALDGFILIHCIVVY